MAGEADVPAEHERHLVLRVALGALDFAGVAGGEEGARLFPDLAEGALEDLALDAGDRLGGDRVEPGVCLVEFAQQRRPRREQGAALAPGP